MSSANNRTTHRLLAGLALAAMLTAMTGCRKNEGAGALPPGHGNSAATAGREVFVASGCMNCHAVGSQGGNKGPDLTHVGSRAGHSIEWLVLKVRNPRALNPTSGMPAFQGKINDRDLLALGGYLAGLK
jgi:mono/diheme cytochrome c family protein